MTQTTPAKARSPRIRLGMVGGGQGAFIGAVHRIAARLDDQYDLVAGCFSSSPEKSAASAAELGVPRAYDDFAQMALREARRRDGIEAVAIVTPNHMHAPVARQFLKRGIHVICDKPLTATLTEAKQLARAAGESDALFVLTHNYTGYPMIRQARAMIAAGELGEIRLVQVEYAQDWLAEPLEASGNKQASWRTDPAKSGLGGGWDKAQILAIMKDSRIGSYGTIGVVLMLLAKAAALVEIAGAATQGVGVALALFVAHPLSRLAATLLMHHLPYVRADDSSKSVAVVRRLTPVELALAAGFGLLPLLLLPASGALCALLAVAVVTAWTARIFLRRLGGYTGDLLGATQQASELGIYLALLAASRLGS